MAAGYPTELRGFVVLRYAKDSPALACCELCQLKFFLPNDMLGDSERAIGYLQQKYLNHQCKGY
jgi:hypothetical protein